MSSGCAPMAKAEGAGCAAGTGLPARRATRGTGGGGGEPQGSMTTVCVAVGRIVRGEDDFVRAHCVFEAGERHLFVALEGREESLELALIGMGGGGARIEEFH